MKKISSKAKSPIVLAITMLLFVMLFSSATVKADAVKLSVPLDFNKCVQIVDGEVLFDWAIENPNNKTISEVTIKVWDKLTTFEILNEALDDNALSFGFEVVGSLLRPDVLYNWQVSAKFNSTVVKSGTFEFAIGVVPTFTENSLPDGANCIVLLPVFDWTQTAYSDYEYVMQLSDKANFSNLITVKKVVDTIATITVPANALEPNTTYYWRLQNEVCKSIFSTVRTFTTKSIALTVKPTTSNDDSIVLIWEDENPEKPKIYYELQVALNAQFTSQMLVDTLIQKDSFKFLFGENSHNKTHYWRVRVVDSTIANKVCRSDWTKTYTFSTPLKSVKPVSPTNSERCVSRNEAVFRWEKSEVGQYYQIWISKKEDFTDTVRFFEIAGDITQSIHQSTVIPLPENTTKYFWKIRQVSYDEDDDISNASAWSNAYGFTTTIPSPILISPEDNTTGVDNIVTLEWHSGLVEEEDGADKTYSYRLQVSRNTDFSNAAALLANVVLSDTTYEFELKNNIQKYYWRVALTDETGCTSDFSDYYYFTSWLETPVIIAPGKLHTVTPIDTLHTNNVVFRWKKVPQGNKYDIEISQNKNAFDNFPTQIIYRLNIVEDSAEVLLDTNKMYYWRIRAKHDNSAGATVGLSEWSDIYRFVTGYNEPTVPKLISPENGATFVSTLPTFRWNSAAFAEEYELRISETPDLNVSADMMVHTSDTTFNLEVFEEFALEIGTKYYWAVIAINKGVYSPLSQIWSFTTVPPPPSEAVILKTPVNNDTTVIGDYANFTWEAVAGAQYYRLQIAKTNNFASPVFDEDIANKTQHRVTTLEKSTTYYWRMKPGNENGLGDNWSEVRTFTTRNILSILDNNYASFMNIAPNPVNGNHTVCNFGLLRDANITVMVIDAIGNEVQRDSFEFPAGSHSIRLNTENLASGIYICKIISDNKIIGTTQFIIAK